MKKGKPSSEMLNTFKEITNFVNKSQSEKNKNINNILNKKQKIKMPMKMYMGIKKAVIKRHEKEKEHNQMVNLIIKIILNKSFFFQNDILAETHRKEKLMTKVILNKLEKKNEQKKNKKLFISRSKAKSRFKDGVLNLSKNFLKNINKNQLNLNILLYKKYNIFFLKIIDLLTYLQKVNFNNFNNLKHFT